MKVLERRIWVAVTLLATFTLIIYAGIIKNYGAAGKKVIEEKVNRVAEEGGQVDTIAAIPSKGVAVLMFHNVKPGTALPPEKFRETLQLLKRNNYNPISLDAFHAYLEGSDKIPPRPVLLTFDDGYQDNYKYAAPILRELKYPAVVFPVMKWFAPYPRRDVDRSGRPAHQPHLSQSELKEMVNNGWNVGGHSYDGHWLVPVDAGGKERRPFLVSPMWLASAGRLENENEYQARVWSDIMLMKYQMLELGLSALDFAFPYGAYNDKLLVMLKEAGFRYFYTTDSGINFPGQELICRLAVKSAPQETLKVLEKLSLTQKVSEISIVGGD